MKEALLWIAPLAVGLVGLFGYFLAARQARR
jgi:hypothetical protein